MTSKILTHSPEEGLRASLSAYKSLLSDYSLRTRQAEDMVALLMNEKIPKEVFQEMVVNKLSEHMSVRSMERTVQLQAVLEAINFAVTNLTRNIEHLTQDQIKEHLIELNKTLAVALHPNNQGNQNDQTTRN